MQQFLAGLIIPVAVKHYRMMARRLILLMGLSVVTFTATADEMDLPTLRKTFLQAELAVNEQRDADYFALEALLKKYPLYPYLRYQWLKKNHLDDDTNIKQFLDDYTGSRYALLLRQKWLQQLAAQKRWPNFLNAYTGSDDAELQCYFGLALLNDSQTSKAMDMAKTLWLSGKSQPEQCDALFTAFRNSADFTTDLIWKRFQAAIQLDNQALATHLSRSLSGSDADLAEAWLKLHRHPELLKTSKDWKRYPQASALLVHALDRWLEIDTEQALAFWNTQKSQFYIAADSLAYLEKRIAMTLAFKQDPRAYAALSRLNSPDEAAREWRVRAALRFQAWPDVITAITALNNEEQHREKWQYWQARSLAELGQATAATIIYQQLAANRSFYGFLAADKLQRPISITDKPVELSQVQLDQLQQQNDIQIAFELLAIDRKQEAKRQWWHAISKLDQTQLMVAAKLAQQWHWPAQAIFTIAKANHWDDVALRFPLEFSQTILDKAQALPLDPAMIFGLIRQESAFDELADSPAGAKGLMQLMPKTARQIADELHDNSIDSNKIDAQLLLPSVNINYGAYYYKKLQQQFHGQDVLAIAAYNAGSNKVKRWLPEKQTLPADIWIETIPYKETRQYVGSVLMYALVYQQRLHRESLKMKDFLNPIPPG